MQFTEREMPRSHGARELDLGREGGHSKRRILHAKDITGREIERALLAAVARAAEHRDLREPPGDRPDHQPEARATSATTAASGAYVLDKQTGQVETFAAPVTRAGHRRLRQGLSLHDQPGHRDRRRRGDGLSRRARRSRTWSSSSSIPPASIIRKAKSFLISEAVRGEGGVLKTHRGRRVHGRVPPAQIARAARHRGPRDRQRDEEERRGSRAAGHHAQAGPVHHRPLSRTSTRPACGYGIDITKEPIPVVPAAHYQCGGVVTNVDGETEIAGPVRRGRGGLHRPARRQPAGQQLPARSARLRASRGRSTSWPHPPEPADLEHPGLAIGQRAQRRTRWWWSRTTGTKSAAACGTTWASCARTSACNARRSASPTCRRKSSEYYWDFIVTSDLLELRNIATVAELIVASALRRPESRGLHYNLDYPEPNPEWAQRDTVLRRSA